MNKNNFLSVTLIISGLALNPLLAESIQKSVIYSKNTNRTITFDIASHLFSRGIEKESADTLANLFINEEDEVLLAALIYELEVKKIVKEAEVLAFLSSAALHKEKVNLNSYDTLLGMIAKITKQPLDTNTKNKLSEILESTNKLSV